MRSTTIIRRLPTIVPISGSDRATTLLATPKSSGRPDSPMPVPPRGDGLAGCARPRSLARQALHAPHAAHALHHLHQAAALHLLHHVAHLLELVQEAVDVLHLHAGALGDAELALGLQELRLAALLRRHGVD